MYCIFDLCSLHDAKTLQQDFTNKDDFFHQQGTLCNTRKRVLSFMFVQHYSVDVKHGPSLKRINAIYCNVDLA